MLILLKAEILYSRVSAPTAYRKRNLKWFVIKTQILMKVFKRGETVVKYDTAVKHDMFSFQMLIY